VSDDVYVWIINSPQQSRCHLCRGLFEIAVNRGDHHINLGKHVVRIVQSAVLENVYFGPQRYPGASLTSLTAHSFQFPDLFL